MSSQIFSTPPDYFSPTALAAALYPALSLITTGTFAVGGAKLRTYADACWQEAMENPYDKLIDASNPAAGVGAAQSSQVGGSALVQNQNQNQGSANVLPSAVTGAQIDARVAHTARSVGGMLLAGSAAWVGIHIVADQTLSSSSSGNGATTLATTLATLLSTGFWVYGCVEYGRAAIRLEKKASRISKNVRANLAL